MGEVIAPTANIPASPPPSSKKQKPVAKLVCPRVAFGSGLGPVVVSATLYVDNPGENLWCPGVEWYIDSDFRGGHESDCPPYKTLRALGEGEPDRWSEDIPRRFPLWQGEHVIIAKLIKSGKVLARAECKIRVP